MKNLFIIILSLFIFYSCGSEDKKENTDQTSNVTQDSSLVVNQNRSETNETGISKSTDKNEVIYKFKKGDEYKYKMTSYSSQDQQVETDTLMKSSANQTVKYLFDMKILDVNSSGQCKISISVNSIELEGNYNGTTVYYNSLDQMSGEERAQFTDYETMANSKFIVTIEPSGRIASISEVDDILEKMMTLKDIQQELNEEEKKRAKHDLSEAAIRPLAQQLFRLTPADTVSPSEIWKHNYVSQISVFNIANTTQYTVDNFFYENGNLKANISARLDVNVEGERNFTKQGVNYSFDEPVITGKGKVVFNITKGIMERSETTTTVKLDMSVDALDASNVRQTAKRSDHSINTNIVELLK